MYKNGINNFLIKSAGLRNLSSVLQSELFYRQSIQYYYNLRSSTSSNSWKLETILIIFGLMLTYVISERLGCMSFILTLIQKDNYNSLNIYNHFLITFQKCIFLQFPRGKFSWYYIKMGKSNSKKQNQPSEPPPDFYADGFSFPYENFDCDPSNVKEYL